MKKFKQIVSVVLCLLMLVAVVPVMEASAVTFSPRFTAPERSGYYGTQNSYNPFRTNSSAGNGNCTWYAWGRAYELLGSRPQLSTNNANTWYPRNVSSGAYPYGSTPKLGAIACWATGDAGHVAVVEAINGDGTITISESSWSATSWWFRTKTINSNCSYYSAFQGFIYIGDYSTSAPTYATLYTDDYSYAVDERVYFHMSSDGTVNNLWIYCPNGQTLTYKDVGTEYDLGFGMSGEYEALVQTWNGLGNYTSERIHFLVGNPTRAEITTDAYSYAVDETVTFTCNTNGTPGRNVVWIYCPNGDTLHYSDLDSELKLGFGMSGEFEALVQAWSGTGSLTSERIHFLVGDPTRAILKTNYEQYLIDERVYFSCDTNGTPFHNTLWIYCPDGTCLHYSDIGSDFDLGFGMTGEYEALVQAWSGTGSLCSERVRFSVFDIPSKPIIRTATGNKDGSVTLEWTPCLANTLSYSIRFYKAGETEEYKLLNRITNETSYTYKGLSAGVYTAMVTAEGKGGHTNSDMSESFTVMSHTHSYTSSITKSATCSATGIRTFTCSCGDTYTETVPINPSNHVNKTNVAAITSTCTVKGYTAGVYCNDCKKYISGHAEQPLAAHKTTTQNAKAAACTTAGYTGDQVCTVCKQTITKGSAIAALGHTSPDSKGNCTRCGQHIKDVTPSQPSNPQPNPNACKYCGKVHTGPFGWLIKFFHSILAIFKR